MAFVCDKFADMKKENTASNVMRALHCAYVAQYHEGDLFVYTDESKDNSNDNANCGDNFELTFVTIAASC